MKPEFPSRFFQVVIDIKDGDIITFKNEGEYIVFPDGTKVFAIHAENASVEKDIRLNKTSYNNLAKQYGEDCSKWIGKAAQANIVKQAVRGELRDVIYLNLPNLDERSNVIKE